MPRARLRPTREAVGLLLTAALVAVAIVVPLTTGWEVATRSDGDGLAPLHGYWDPKVALATVPVLLLAVLGWWLAPRAERLPWRTLLATSYVVGLAWLLALALVDGQTGLTRVLGNPYEYLETARAVTDVPAMLEEFIDRIPYSSPDNWVTHVAGHPPGALLFFVALARLGLGGDLAAALVVTAMAASVAPAVLVTLRALGAEPAARRAAPFLVLGPAAVFLAVSADAVFTVFAAWGLAALALGATRVGLGARVGWSVVAGLLLGSCVLLSYGLPLLGLIAVAVLVVARSWLPLPVAAATAGLLVLGFAAAGFAWWDALPVLRERYLAGLSAERPAAYWVWGNLAALALAAGPAIGAGLTRILPPRREPSGDGRAVRWLAGAAVLAVVVADASLMSKAEVERIWLPFIPWLLVSCALLSTRWRRVALACQLTTAVLLQHLLYTSW